MYEDIQLVSLNIFSQFLGSLERLRKMTVAPSCPSDCLSVLMK